MTSLNHSAILDAPITAAAPELPRNANHGEASTGVCPPLEAACVQLIARLDPLRVEAAGYRAMGRYVAAAAQGRQMLLAVLDFAEENLEGEPLKGVQERVADAYDQSKRVDDLVATQRWGAVRRALGKSTAEASEVAEAHHALGEAIAVAVITAVAGGGDRFQPGSELARKMADALKWFIDGLRTDW